MRLRTAPSDVRWEHLDPAVTAKIRACAVAVPLAETGSRASTGRGSTAATTSVEVRSDTSRVADWNGSAFAVVIAFLVLLLYVSVCFHWGGPGMTLLLIVLPVGLGCVAGSTNRTRYGSARSQRAAPRLKGRLPRDTARLYAALAGADLAPLQQVYAEIVVLINSTDALDRHLGDAGERSPNPRFRFRRAGSERRFFLRECNTLLSGYDRLEARRLRIERITLAWDARDTPGLLAEHTALLARRNAATDPLSRESLSRSADLCAERIEQARELPTLRARLEAHQEVIRQTLLLTQAVLARAAGAPDALRIPEIDALHRATHRVATHTRAVEAAFTEMETLA